MTKKFFKFIIYAVISIVIVILLCSMTNRILSKENYTNILEYTFLEVVTGSMSGTIEIGDGIIVKLTSEIKENDIIVYKKADNLITHRLIKIEEDRLITKGDANNVQDDPITKDMILGKVIFIIPKIHFWKKAIIILSIILICMLVIIQRGRNIKRNKMIM